MHNDIYHKNFKILFMLKLFLMHKTKSSSRISQIGEARKNVFFIPDFIHVTKKVAKDLQLQTIRNNYLAEGNVIKSINCKF